MTDAAAEEISPLTVRFPKQLLDRARDQAKADRRSLNNEIVYLVNRALDEIEQSSDKSGSGA